MEMKLEEAQICRLCGECESIYIDVFGEEGTKRFLGVKIHTKINILIDETDPLPKAICVQCLGKLEFVCDFQDECLHTQQVLRERYNLPPLSDAIEKDDGLSHNVCINCLGALEFQCDFIEQCHKTQEKLKEAKKKSGGPKEDSTVQSELPDDVDSNKENISPNVPISSNKKTRQTFSGDELKNSKTDSAVLNKSLPVTVEQPSQLLPENNVNNNDNTKTIAEIAQSFEKPCETGSSDLTRSTAEKESSKSLGGETTERTTRRVITNSSNTKSSKTKKTTNSTREKLTAGVVIKAEKNVDGALPRANPKIMEPNRLVWIPRSPKLPEACRPKSLRFEKSQKSPPLGDEAEVQTVQSTNFNKDKDNKRVASIEIARKSDPKKSEVSSKAAQPMTPTNRGKRQTKSQVSYVDNDDDSSNCGVDSDSKERPKKFAKIKDLISEEQKMDIEKYFALDMSAVNGKVVSEKIVMLDNKRFACQICEASYTRHDKCQVHVWGHLEMKPYRCKACDFSTVTISNIRCHVRKSHLKLKPYACDMCEKRYPTAFQLEEHSNTHSGTRPYACDLCDFASASRQVLSYHKTTHKPVKDITCQVCGKEFYSKNRLRAHMVIHNKDKDERMCKLCSIYLSNSEALQKHLANVHSKDYVCNICGKRCQSRKALNNHGNVHSAAKHKCTLCSNVYKSSHILKEHLLKHKGIRKYICNLCRKDFAQQSHLAAHMAVHSDDRFFCPGCKKAFNRRDNMKMHTKRCEEFLAKPELKSLLEIRKSRSKPADPQPNQNPVNTLKSPNNQILNYFKPSPREKNVASHELFESQLHSNENHVNHVTTVIESVIPCT